MKLPIHSLYLQTICRPCTWTFHKRANFPSVFLFSSPSERLLLVYRHFFVLLLFYFPPTFVVIRFFLFIPHWKIYVYRICKHYNSPSPNKMLILMGLISLFIICFIICIQCSEISNWMGHSKNWINCPLLRNTFQHWNKVGGGGFFNNSRTVEHGIFGS